MKVLAVALDYDGTIAFNDVLDPAVRESIARLRSKGIVVLIVTGRILSELKRVAGDLHFVDGVVAENGAVVEFTTSGYSKLLASPPSAALLAALAQEGIRFLAGQSVVDVSAADAARVLALVEGMELPLSLAFNRSRLMVLPQAVSKATGLREALSILRLSVHNTLAIGDAENDHELLHAAEFGLAVQWGSEALKAAADDVLSGEGPGAVGAYLKTIAETQRMPRSTTVRRKLLLGYNDSGSPFSLGITGRTTLVVGDTKSGKSWVAGLLCEQMILFGYSLFIIDPEGDYTSLEALPGVTVYGGADPLPRPREILRTLRHADTSVVIDFSHKSHAEKVDYVRALLPGLATLRRHTGLPHRIVMDEAHYFLPQDYDPDVLHLEDGSYIFVSYRPSWMQPAVLKAVQAILATRTSSPSDIALMCSLCKSCKQDDAIGWIRTLDQLLMGEAAILPITEETGGVLERIRLAPRLTPHSRHAAKYIDIPVPQTEQFIFWQDDRASGPYARTLRELVQALEHIAANSLKGHLARHDFSRWIGDVFGDYPLGKTITKFESQAGSLGIDKVRVEICDAIRSRYDFVDPLPQMPMDAGAST